MPEETKEIPKLYQLTANHIQLQMIGMALSHMGARLTLDVDEMVLQNTLLVDMVRELGPDQTHTDLQTMIDQVAMLDGVPKCPHCGDYHKPQEDHDATGNPEQAN